MNEYKQNELVSVIVPIYNVEKYLKRCLDSIVNQTYKNIEIICIDDGSPDNSIDILRAFEKKDNRIKIIRQKNMGLSGARNTGIDIAKGKYIIFVDSDDYIELDMIELMLGRIKNSDIDLVVCGTANHIGTIVKKEELYNFKKKEIKNGILYFKENYKLKYRFANCWNKMYKTEIIKSNNIEFPIGKLYEDLLFVFKYLINCKKVVIEPKALYNYIVSRDGAITTKINKNDMPDTIWTLYELEKYLIGNGMSKVIDTWEYKEYLFFWVSGATINKLINSDEEKKEKNMIINKLKIERKYKEYASYILKNSNDIKKKIYIKVLYFNNILFLFLLKLNAYRIKFRRR